MPPATPPLCQPGSYARPSFARRFDRYRCLADQSAVLERIDRIHPLTGARVVELGAGTGVLSETLAARARCLVAVDRSPAMLRVARARLARFGPDRANVVLAEHRKFPFPSSSFDLAVAAFAFDALLRDAGQGSWRQALDAAIGEMVRVLVPGGAAVIVAAPAGPFDLRRHLTTAWGFSSCLVATRWRFPSKRRARATVRFFFGERVWRDYAPHRPKILATPAAILWRSDRHHGQLPCGGDTSSLDRCAT